MISRFQERNFFMVKKTFRETAMKLPYTKLLNKLDSKPIKSKKILGNRKQWIGC